MSTGKNRCAEIINSSCQDVETTYGGPYVHPYVSSELKLFECDGLMTYADQLYYEKFATDPDKWIKHHKVVNFNIIDTQCRSDKLITKLKQHHKATKSDSRFYPYKEEKVAVSAVRRSQGPDIFLEKD